MIAALSIALAVTLVALFLLWRARPRSPQREAAEVRRVEEVRAADETRHEAVQAAETRRAEQGARDPVDVANERIRRRRGAVVP
jgi:hypothetical protein